MSEQINVTTNVKYEDNYKTDEQGVRWVKLKHANSAIQFEQLRLKSFKESIQGILDEWQEGKDLDHVEMCHQLTDLIKGM